MTTGNFYFRAIAGKIEACPPEEAMHAAKSATESKTIATGPNFRTKTLPRLPEPSHDGNTLRPSYGDQRNPSAKCDIGTGNRNRPFVNHWVNYSPEPTGPSPSRWIVKAGKIGFLTATARARSPRLRRLATARRPCRWHYEAHRTAQGWQRQTWAQLRADGGSLAWGGPPL